MTEWVLSLLYYIILYALLVVTSYLSVKTVRVTVGKSINYQFNSTLVHKVFWFAVLSYVISFILLSSYSYFDFINYYGSSHFFDASLFFLLSLFFNMVEQPYTGGASYTEQIWLYLAILVFVTFIVSVIINYFIVLKDLVLKKSNRLYASLIISAMTAPYFYFVPFGGLFY